VSESASTEPARKSKGVAVFYSLIFGPLGLLYVGGWWQASVMIAAALPFMLTRQGGLWLAVVARLIAAVWAYSLVVEQDEALNPQRDAGRLLDEAARLESVDFHKAMQHTKTSCASIQTQTLVSRRQALLRP